jgi:hypothetical protein
LPCNALSASDLPLRSSRVRLLALDHLRYAAVLAAGLLLTSFPASAQNAPPAAPAPDATASRGQVLFQSHGVPLTTPENTTAPALSTTQPTGAAITDAQRSAFSITAYDLDARLRPESSHLAMHARIGVRNSGSTPLSRIILQLSSSLAWESASLIGAGSATPLPLAQHLVETDADHTGKASEAVFDLPAPLAPGATLTLDTLYSGTIALDATRLDRIGASSAQALDTDWDTISGNATSSTSNDVTPSTLLVALRGFGDVLWYPVASPPLFLGDGAKLFQAVAAARFAEQNAAIHLHLAIEYKGDPPVAAYFCGRRQPLAANPDNPDMPIATGAGIATADFSTEPLGFRQPSLFVVEIPESLIAPLPLQTAGSSAKSGPAPTVGEPMLAVETANDGALPPVAATAESIAPMLQHWFGEKPLTALTILDHPGTPFEDGPLLVAPLDSLATSSASAALAHSLTHAWVQTGQPWFDEGLAQFIALLWTEQEKGRDAAILQLNNLIQPLNIAEPGFASKQAADAASAPTGQPLISASDELYYRRKAAAVWWMLRGIVGDAPLQQALTAWRSQPVSHDSPTAQAVGFEKLLEKTSGKDLGWFFSDWVLRDRGLPDLSIVDVAPRQLPAGKGHDTGWLVAVTVHNDGAPAVDVPLVVRSGISSTTTRIHIPGFSNETDRILVESPPTQVILNDGSTPEIRSSMHTHDVVIQAEPSF